MRRFPMLVLMTGVMASLPGLPLPTRTAAAALPRPSCAQKRSACMETALNNYYQCEMNQNGNCASTYEAATQTCNHNYQVCMLLGG
jgi:hypothetical protein